MAGKKENIKALFSNTRTRVIILFTIILLVTSVVIGVFKMGASQENLSVSTKVKKVPTGIHSIPGSLNQTAQYATLQNTQNIDQAETASKSGGSAIPTIIKTQAFGEGVDLIGPQYGEGGAGFVTLSRSNMEGASKSLWFQALQTEHCSNAAIKTVVDKGATISDLREECNCCQLRQYGYTLSDLDPVCSCSELKAAGFTAREMKVSGYTAGQLRRCGFSACETRGAGFNAEDMKDGGFTNGELKGAGFTEESIEAANGLPAGISIDDVRKAGCDPEKLARLRVRGVSAAAIQRISACSVAQLKAAGFSADDLKRAGASAAALKAAGFTPEELKKAGYKARDLLNAGFSSKDLTDAGFSAEQIEKGQDALPPGVTTSQLKKAGCSVETLKRERLAGVSAKLIRQSAGCGIAALKAAGFTDADLTHAGFKPADIANTPAQAEKQLTDAEIAAVRAAGCDADKLKALRPKGISAKQIHDLNGCTAEQLKAAGFSVKELSDAGFTPAELLAAGFDSGALNNAGLIPASVIAEGRKKGCSVKELKAARSLGVSATTMRETLGCSAEAMKAAGYSAQELKDAGYSAAELKDAGYSAQELKDAGYSAAELKDAGYSAAELKDAGYSAAELKDAGYSAAELKDAGYSAAELKDAGYSAAELKYAGYNAAELKDAGYGIAALKAAGFTDADLTDAGFKPADIANTPAQAEKQLTDAEIAAVRAAGCDADKLKALRSKGISAKQIHDLNGCTAEQLKAAGFSPQALKDAGYSAQELKDAGLTDAQLKDLRSSVEEKPTTTQGTENATDRSSITRIPSIDSTKKGTKKAVKSDTKQLQELMARQQSHISDQKYQAAVKQLSGRMLSAAGRALQDWKNVSTQVFILGSEKNEGEDKEDLIAGGVGRSSKNSAASEGDEAEMQPKSVIIKTGDILFAVLDTSVNTDEPGPILATIVSGKLKGSKLIGSFTLPSNADKMVVTFNTLSMQGADQTISISAYAIDPNTARTALASRVNHHYLMRYGSLFASTFLAGFSSAIQSADTTITIGGTGGTTDTTVQNGINRSLLENALIGLGEVGKAWSETAQELMSRPTTIELFSGTGMGILFTQDVQIA